MDVDSGDNLLQGPGQERVWGDPRGPSQEKQKFSVPTDLKGQVGVSGG